MAKKEGKGLSTYWQRWTKQASKRMRDQETDTARQAKKERDGNKLGERQKARGNCDIEKGADQRERTARERDRKSKREGKRGGESSPGRKVGRRKKVGRKPSEGRPKPRHKRGREPAESLCEGEGGGEARSRHMPTCP